MASGISVGIGLEKSILVKGVELESRKKKNGSSLSLSKGQMESLVCYPITQRPWVNVNILNSMEGFQ